MMIFKTPTLLKYIVPLLGHGYYIKTSQKKKKSPSLILQVSVCPSLQVCQASGIADFFSK